MSDSNTLSKETKINLGLAITVLLALFGAHHWMDARFDAMESTIQKIEFQVEAAGEERWKSTRMEVWALRLALANPEMAVPDPKNTMDKIIVSEITKGEENAR